METQVFKYEGLPVTFRTGDTTMVNATEMAKPFGKKPAKWLELPSTKEFIAQLCDVRNSDFTPIVTRRGNSSDFEQGTWMHEDVALEFARWLSPKFGIWCNDRIKELMRYGVTATPQAIDNILANPDNMIRMLQAIKEEREKVRQLELSNKKLEVSNRAYQSEHIRLVRMKQNADKEKKRDAPLVEYAKNILSSSSTFTTTQIAKELSMSACALNRLLHAKGVQYREGGQWFIYTQYSDKGYVATRQNTYQKKDGRMGVLLQTVWTTAGRSFIHELVGR